ncbi:MAG: aminotransferase class I/II-fold pyridoxal phosphate-dependent enzyme [Candidatus Promineifilaceae bacterium]|nr:aminotransferase class I/II-fold pyridoxal phosphate-dependent enzyme [Candidatus Promineifilaceae bacterium]
MKVKIHDLFEFLLETTAAEPEAILGFSLARSPRLGDFLSDLDPDLSLDWSNQSFQGLTALRERVVARSALEEVCGPDDVLITAGAAEANFLALTNLLRPGDEMIVDTPGWPQPLVLGEALDVRIRRLPRREADGWRFDLDELAAMINPRTRLIFLCNPNNPTGQVLEEAALQRIAALADEVGAYLLCDEVYAGLEWEGERVPAIAGFYERGISTGSVSKTLGLQGLRIGWLISRDRQVVQDAVVLRENTSEIMNVLGEHVAEIALRPERYAAAVARAKWEGRENLALLDAFIEARPELSWQRPAAGFIGLARLHLPIDGETLARRLLEAPYRTFLIPGSAYGCPQHIRLGVGGGPEVELQKGLGRLEAFLDDYRRGST